MARCASRAWHPVMVARAPVRAASGVPERPRSIRPAWNRRLHGDYCLQATCHVLGTNVRIIGYDRYIDIATAVQEACTRYACGDDDGGGVSCPGCSPVSLFLMRCPRKECCGQIFEVFPDGTSRRLP